MNKKIIPQGGKLECSIVDGNEGMDIRIKKKLAPSAEHSSSAAPCFPTTTKTDTYLKVY